MSDLASSDLHPMLPLVSAHLLDARYDANYQLIPMSARRANLAALFAAMCNRLAYFHIRLLYQLEHVFR